MAHKLFSSTINRGKSQTHSNKQNLLLQQEEEEEEEASKQVNGRQSPRNVSKDNKFLDPEEFKRQGYMIIDFLSNYYKHIHEYPVLSRVDPGYLAKSLPSSAPLGHEPLENILEDVTKFILPGLTHWQSPGFHGYFPIGGSAASILGELLSAGFSITSFTWLASPAATELENLVMDWLARALGLPEHFLFSGSGGGMMHGSTCEAIVCTLVAARDRALAEAGQGSMERLVVYCSDQTHCSFQKAARIVGISPNNIRALKTTLATSYGLSPVLLSETIKADADSGLIPLYLCATIGTTSTTAVDPLLPLCQKANKYGIWVHVDAAYAGAALSCPEFREFATGIELVDSFSFNAHKWLLCAPTGCSCVWVKDREILTRSLSMDADYLKNKPSELSQVIDYKDWQIPLSKRFTSLKVWLVLRSYGIEDIQNHIRNHIRLARIFEGLVEEDERFEITCPRKFALVCFRLLSPGTANSANGHAVSNGHSVSNSYSLYASKGEGQINKINEKLLHSINESGRIFLTHTVIEGMYIIRFSVGAAMSKEEDVRMAWKVVQEHASLLLQKQHDQAL